MTIHHSARYQVKAPEAGTAKAAIAAFAEYVANEPGSKMPTAFRDSGTHRELPGRHVPGLRLSARVRGA